MKSLLSLFMVLLVVGCASVSQIEVIPELQDVGPLLPGEGVVVLQIADTTPTGQVFPTNQADFASKDVNLEEGGKIKRASSIDGGGLSTQLIVVKLPANDYSLSSLRAYVNIGESWFSRFYPAGLGLGTFKVEPGKITDLGTLVLYVRRKGDDYTYATSHATANDNGLNSFREQYPNLAQGLNNLAEPIGWDESSFSTEIEEHYHNAVQRQVVFRSPYIDGNKLSFPGRMGVILQRSNDKNWSLDAFDEDIELVSYTEFMSGNETFQVIADEFSRIHYRSDPNSEWRSQSPKLESGRIAYVATHPEDGLFMISEYENQIQVWHGEAPGKEWRLLDSLQHKKSLWQSWNGTAMDEWLNRTQNNYVLKEDSLYLVLAKSLFRYDIKTSKFTELDVSETDSIQMRNGAITLHATGFLGGNKVTFDSGETWNRYRGRTIYKGYKVVGGKVYNTNNEIENPKLLPRAKLVGHPIFANEQLVFSLHKGITKEGPLQLVSSKDGGTFWRFSETKLPENCNRLLQATEEELLLHCMISGEIYRSDDLGSSWVLEREVSEN